MTDANRLDRDRAPARVLRGFIMTVAILTVAALMTGCVAVRRAEDGSLVFVTLSDARKQAEKPKKKVAASKEESAGEHPKDTSAAPVGTPLTSGNWEVIVTSADEKKKLPNGKKPAKGKVFLLVEVKIANIGTASELNVRPKQFWMSDASGKKVKAYKAGLAAFNARQVRPVLIGMASRTTFVYEVPKNPSGYVFTFKRRDTAKEILHWQVP